MAQGFTSNAPVYTGYTAPTQQRFTSGSGTYTTPAGVKYIRVRMVGGGGGGGGSCTSAGNDGGTGGSGGSTTFGSSLLTAAGGSPGSGTSQIAGGAGGAATVNSPAVDLGSYTGTYGENCQETNVASVNVGGKSGGQTAFGGRGSGGSSVAPGVAALSNSGAGGGGAGAPAQGISGSGGGAGAYVDALISDPSASYSYAVGAAGTAGAAGTGGYAGGAGGTGVIVVEEYYQLNTYGELLTFTGTGNAVKETSPNIITPTVVGVSDASSADTGDIGELVTSNIPYSSAVSLVTATDKDVTSISLTAGDWDVWGNLFFDISGTATQFFAWISTTSMTLPDNSLAARLANGGGLSSQAMTCPYIRINVNSTTTVYLSARATFSTGTATACGSIFARRAR